jgi:hypothetical protein
MVLFIIFTISGTICRITKDEKAIITLREPFDRLIAVSDHPKYWETWDGLRTFPWREFRIFIEEMIPFAA